MYTNVHGRLITSLAIIMCGTAAIMIASDGIIPPAMADDPATTTSIISTTTDKTNYVHGDVIIISGKITTSLIDTPVILQIFRENNPVYINQITPGEDGTYWDIVKAEGTKWTNTAEYTVNIRYGKDAKATTTFNFVSENGIKGGGNGDGTVTDGHMEVEAGNETFDVAYSIIGGTVTDMILDWRDFTLVVDIDVTDKVGSITMEMPRKYIGAERTESSTNVSDDSFIVLIDGVEAIYNEVDASQTTRKIKVDFAEGDSEIRIIGTYAVPEFSHIVMLVILAGGMLAMIAFARTKSARGRILNAGMTTPV